MFLSIPIIKTKLKPIISVNILTNGNYIPVQALIDTGSSKAFWVGTNSKFKELATSSIANNGTASGLGLITQKSCPTSTMNVNIRDAKYGINFRNVPVTQAKVENASLFSLILPYTLFTNFDFGFKFTGIEPYGLFYLNTQDNQINYKAVAGVNDIICGAYVCTDEHDSFNAESSKELSAF